MLLSRIVNMRWRLVAPVASALAAACLFGVYIRVSGTYPENSDEANILLQARDMLSGNILLHGWILSDASFFSLDLPQYAVLERLLGVRPQTAHVAAAMTYTVVLILATLLALGRRGDVPPRQRGVRALITAGIMIAPQLGVGVFIVLLSVGHIGTAVPLLVGFLLIDRNPARPWVPAAVGIALAWGLIGDPLVLLDGVIPLAAVSLLRARRLLTTRVRAAGRRWWSPSGHDLALAGAAGASYAVASYLEWLFRLDGGYTVLPVPYRLSPPGQWAHQALTAGQGWLALFGAKPDGSWPVLLALPHLVSVVLVLSALYLVARRFLIHADPVSQVLLVAIVLNIAAYLPSTLAAATDLNARELVLTLPFGAVLAGRTLAAPLARAWPRHRARLLAARLWPVVPVIYLGGLGYAAARPPAPVAGADLAAWLSAHRLTQGIGGYWQASAVTLASGGAITIRAVTPGRLRPYFWETRPDWYDSTRHRATFLVTEQAPGGMVQWLPDPAAVAGLGPPSHTYRAGTYTIYVWHKNLLARFGPSLARISPAGRAVMMNESWKIRLGRRSAASWTPRSIARLPSLAWSRA